MGLAELCACVCSQLYTGKGQPWTFTPSNTQPAVGGRLERERGGERNRESDREREGDVIAMDAKS